MRPLHVALSGRREVVHAPEGTGINEQRQHVVAIPWEIHTCSALAGSIGPSHTPQRFGTSSATTCASDGKGCHVARPEAAMPMCGIRTCRQCDAQRASEIRWRVFIVREGRSGRQRYGLFIEVSDLHGRMPATGMPTKGGKAAGKSRRSRCACRQPATAGARQVLAQVRGPPELWRAGCRCSLSLRTVRAHRLDS
jgi:hypothetical protein